MGPTPEVKYTLIGDIVGSRRKAADRADLQADVVAVAKSVSRSLPVLEEVRPTIGDEVQGAFASLGDAVRATLLLRLELLAASGADARFGIGLGEVTVFDSGDSTQDGPGWWSARSAIEDAEAMGRRKQTAFVRVRFESDRAAEGRPSTSVDSVNAFLILRDQLIALMNPRRRRLLLGTVRGERQVDLAEKERIKQSAVSQGLAASGARAIVAAEKELMT